MLRLIALFIALLTFLFVVSTSASAQTVGDYPDNGRNLFSETETVHGTAVITSTDPLTADLTDHDGNVTANVAVFTMDETYHAGDMVTPKTSTRWFVVTDPPVSMLVDVPTSASTSVRVDCTDQPDVGLVTYAPDVAPEIYGDHVRNIQVFDSATGAMMLNRTEAPVWSVEIQFSGLATLRYAGDVYSIDPNVCVLLAPPITAVPTTTTTTIVAITEIATVAVVTEIPTVDVPDTEIPFTG